MHHATQLTTQAYIAMLLYAFAPYLLGHHYLLIAHDLEQSAARNAKAATYAMAGAMMLIDVAAIERRIGVITGIGES